MIRAILTTSISVALLVLLGLPLILYSLLIGNSDALYRLGMWGCRVALRLAGVQTEVHGREKIPSGQAVVFMANHQSNCDPPAILTLLPPVLVLVKKEFFRVPILGWGMRLRGFIPVDRKNREHALRAVEKAVEAIKAGHSFLVFPEGTRSRDGRLQPFKKGVFVLAIKAQAPIVPISFSGGSKIMPKGKFAIRPGRVRITFHDPIPTAGFSMDDRGQLTKGVRLAILSGLAEHERASEWPVLAGVEEIPEESATLGVRSMHGIASGGRHELAVAFGFHREDVDGEIILYEHPEKGILHTFADGSWKHVASNGTETNGFGSDELGAFLSSVEKKVRIQ